DLDFISTVTGDALRRTPDAGYWVEHALGPVRFLEGTRTLVAAGVTDLLEIGPGTTLLSLARQCTGGATGRTLSRSSSRGPGEAAAMLGSLAKLHQHGQPIDWPAFHRGRKARRVPLPLYPFQGRRFWLDGSQPTAAETEATDIGALAGHRLRSALPDVQF